MLSFFKEVEFEIKNVIFETMRTIIGIMITFTTYGTWLQGDKSGSKTGWMARRCVKKKIERRLIYAPQ